MERINLKLHLLAFEEIGLFNAFFWERKVVFGKLMKKGRECRIRTPRSRPCFQQSIPEILFMF